MSASERRFAQLEDENRKLREQLARVAGGADSLEMESGVKDDRMGFALLQMIREVRGAAGVDR